MQPHLIRLLHQSHFSFPVITKKKKRKSPGDGAAAWQRSRAKTELAKPRKQRKYVDNVARRDRDQQVPKPGRNAARRRKVPKPAKNAGAAPGPTN